METFILIILGVVFVYCFFGAWGYILPIKTKVAFNKLYDEEEKIMEGAVENLVKWDREAFSLLIYSMFALVIFLLVLLL